MMLYFLRHGPALDRDEWNAADRERPLTPSGTERVERLAGFMAGLDLAIEEVITSPYIRARQTAAIVAQSLGLSDCLTEDSRLEPGFDLDAMNSLLTERAGLDSILLVGHEPDLSALLGTLIGGGRIGMKKGALACVKGVGPLDLRGELAWLLPPSIMSGTQWK
jgi:phosphohistidine phosphatase